MRHLFKPGSALFLPSKGIVSTLPFLALCTLLPSLIVEKYYFMPALSFATTYLFAFSVEVPALLSDVPGGFPMFVAVCAAAVSLASCLCAFLIKKAVKSEGKKWLYTSGAVLALFVSVCLSLPVNGTPWGAVKAKENIDRTIDEKFFREELSVGNVYYVPSRGLYACDAAPVGTVGEKPSLTFKNGVVCENLTDRIVDQLYADTVTELTNALRTSFANDSFHVSVSGAGKSLGRLSVNSAEELRPYIGYTVTVNSEETAKSFAEKVEDYVAALDGSGIKANKLTFAGGAKQKLYYRIEVETGAPLASAASLIKPYDSALPFSRPFPEK